MRTTSNKSHIYIGKQAGLEIIKEIKNAKKSVKIVSPYTSPDYIKELIALHNKGRDITLITSDKLTESRFSDFKTADLVRAEKILDEKLKHRRKTGVYLSSIGAFVSLMVLSSTYFLASLIYVSIILFLASMTSLFYFSFSKPYTTIYKPIFRIKVFDSTSGENPKSTELIHSKIFIIDESLCFLGSVNLTYSGFKTHYETAIKVEDAAAVKDISHEVEMLYNSTSLRAKDIREWANIG